MVLGIALQLLQGSNLAFALVGTENRGGWGAITRRGFPWVTARTKQCSWTSWRGEVCPTVPMPLMHSTVQNIKAQLCWRLTQDSPAFGTQLIPGASKSSHVVLVLKTGVGIPLGRLPPAIGAASAGVPVYSPQACTIKQQIMHNKTQ
jgi:hypothetical protein